MRISDWSSDGCSSDLALSVRTSPFGDLFILRPGRWRFRRPPQISKARSGDVGAHSRTLRDPVPRPCSAQDPNLFAVAQGGQLCSALEGKLGGLLVDHVQRLQPGRAALLLSLDRKSTRLNSSHYCASRMPSSAGKKTDETVRHR